MRCRSGGDDKGTLSDETSPAVPSIADTGQGTLEQPVTLEAPPPATTGTTLAAGWTWFSINTVPADATVSTLFAG